MTDDSSPVSERAEKRAAQKTRREKNLERENACFDLFVSGYSREEIAKALK
jgi:DNA-binding CsgD family transcriptional regulator